MMCSYADNAKKGDIAMLFYILYFNYIWTFIILTVIAGIAAFIYFKNRPKIVALEEMKPSRKKDLLIGLRDNAGVFSELLEPLFAVATKKSGRKEWVMDSWKEAVDSIEGYEEFKDVFEEKFFELYGRNAAPLIKNKNATKEEKKVYKAKKKALKKIKKADKKIKKAARKKAKINAKKAKFESKLTVAKDKKKKKLAKKAAKCEKKIVKIDKKLLKAENKLYTKYAVKLVKYLLKAGIIRNTDTYITADETTAEIYDTIGEVSLEKDAVYDVHLPFWSLVVRRRDGLEELLAKAEAENAAPTEKDSVTNEEAASEAEATVTADATVEIKEETKEEAPAVTETPVLPLTKKEKKAAKKAAKKEKKKAKKAAKKDKKLNKKIAKLERKLLKAKKAKKKAKIEKKIAGKTKRLSKNKELKKAIYALPVASTETLLSKGAVK